MTPLPKAKSIIPASLATVRLDSVYDQRKDLEINLPHIESSLQSDCENQSQYAVSKIQNKTFKYPFVSRDIERYEYVSQNEFLNYGLTSNDQSTTDFIEYPKVIVSDVINSRIKATFFENAAIADQSFSIIIEKSEDFSLLFLLGLLNSKLFTYFIHEQSLNENSNSFTILHLNLLQSLPIVICDPIDQEKIADLAYELSSMKAQYYTFKKSFINFISLKFNCILNSPKLQNWNELKFKEFVQELSKEKIKLSTLEVSEWKKYFNVEKEKAHELKDQINEIDQEIDEMVYELYELSEEVIRIVDKEVS